MAILRNGILGGFSGKAGAVVGYQLFGQDIMRGLGRIRNTPPTPKELANQRKFATSQNWLKPITEFLRVGFQDYKPKCHGFVAAKSYISHYALKGEDPDFYIDPELACVSYGSLDPGETSSAVLGENRTIVFTWDTNSKYAYDDRAMVVAYDVVNGNAMFDTAIAKRPVGTATLALTERYWGQKVHLYLGFVSEDRKNRSISKYLGSIDVP